MDDIKKRCLEIFENLLLIHSPTKNEIKVCNYILQFLKKLNATIYLDENQHTYGGNTPTIFAKINGTQKGGISFSAHMDVVEPNKGLKIIKNGDIWTSDGNTTLGGDDKAGIAAILTVIEYLVTKVTSYPDLYMIFTPSEESGMHGAKSIQWEKVYQHIKPAKKLIVLDNSGKSNKVAYQAPTSYTFRATIHGKAAHAGIEPEKGRNAITATGKIISCLKIGRIDELTTSNISKISSNFPTNVVPDSCEFEGEVRAQEKHRAIEILNSYEQIIKTIVGKHYTYTYTCNYPALRSNDNLAFVHEFIAAYQKIGITAEPQIIGGGSDANFFAQEGFNSIIIGVGMGNVHTKSEFLDTTEMITAIKAILAYINNMQNA